MVALGALWVFCAGCLGNPQRGQAVQLLERLTTARQSLAAPATAEDGCTMVGDVETRLFGEPGLADLRPAYRALTDAAEALDAVCGQTELLARATGDTQAIREARARWQQGVQRELGVACDRLRAAATALSRAAAC